MPEYRRPVRVVTRVDEEFSDGLFQREVLKNLPFDVIGRFFYNTSCGCLFNLHHITSAPHPLQEDTHLLRFYHHPVP